MENTLKIGMAQISPIWLNKVLTIEKTKSYIIKAAKEGCELVVFGESFLPGYPFWLSITNASEFESQVQKEIHAHYIKNAIQIETGELDEICALAKEHKIAIYLGIIERAKNRGGHSLYCSLVYINEKGDIKSVHRKLQPTYEERLSWSPGDGNGLEVHSLKQFTVGGLNCWENWMPLPRTALYAQGENLHIAVWPGAERNTIDITKFIAKEARSFVVSVSGYMTVDDFPKDTPNYGEIIKNAPQILANGGSCIAGPDGEWIIPPVTGKEDLIVATIDFQKVLEERHNFDPSGHYSRPDVTKLTLNKERQSVIEIISDN
ncbi:carbon-nitrogen hydrolase family protein [Tenacibaculum ovolyticum]|uniref:carbon-nitrogen hydrolase family protein n=1 Tax=Tenacibaculum ovolyticum TaxID=104270 RepID=UPI0022F3F87B|nr:carbon-nitrogen hydrolase family protein [Tenacibaculum ovolyticum]WBX76952.1 carbon-nitrogen hydrolase family protein [Tenacibaculum ovolyticum]